MSHACLPQVASSLRRVCRQCSDTARLHHQRAKTIGRSELPRLWSTPSVLVIFAEATRGHHSFVHAVLGGPRLKDPGITTEPRGLTETQSRPADIFHHRCCPRTQRGSGRVWHPLMFSQTYELKASPIVRWFGQLKVRHTKHSTQQTSHRAATISKCQQKPSSTDGTMTFK